MLGKSTVGETDLATDHALAAHRSQGAQACQDAIGVVEGKAGIPPRERCNLARVVHRRERLRYDGIAICWGKRHAASYLEVRATPSATAIFNVRESPMMGRSCSSIRYKRRPNP